VTATCTARLSPGCTPPGRPGQPGQRRATPASGADPWPGHRTHPTWRIPDGGVRRRSSCWLCSLVARMRCLLVACLPALDIPACRLHQPYTRKVAEKMLILTQVAPYAEGPAGVHGVLGQATTALCELAELAGLSPSVVDDVRDLHEPLARTDRRRPHPRPVSPSGRPPSPKRSEQPSWTRAGRPARRARRALGHRCLPLVARVRLGPRCPLRRPPWTQSFAIDVVDPLHPATAHLGPTWAWARRDLPLPCATGPTPTSCSGSLRTKSISP